MVISFALTTTKCLEALKYLRPMVTEQGQPVPHVWVMPNIAFTSAFVAPFVKLVYAAPTSNNALQFFGLVAMAYLDFFIALPFLAFVDIEKLDSGTEKEENYLA